MLFLPLTATYDMSHYIGMADDVTTRRLWRLWGGVVFDDSKTLGASGISISGTGAVIMRGVHYLGLEIDIEYEETSCTPARGWSSSPPCIHG